jgi:hypothetical protein
MRTGTIPMKIIMALIFAVFLCSHSAYADELEQYGNTCKEIGFKPKTPDYGDCVLELRKRDLNKAQKQKSNSGGSNKDYEARAAKYFQQQEEQYQRQIEADNINASRQQAEYERQKADYDQQKAAYDSRLAEAAREKERQKGLKLLELGLRMSSGQSVRDAAMATAGMQPLPPIAPTGLQRHENFRVTNGQGDFANCTYDPNTKTATCR